MNLPVAAELIQNLQGQGVQSFVVCAGARNAPLVKMLSDRVSGQRIHHFFDERSAAFFALGRARREGAPVVVITTSGTAAAELLPATIEAHYSGVPLVLVTADRPAEYRGTGAPQAIEQVGLFSHYVPRTFDIQKLDEVGRVQLRRDGPTHVNVCFREPLLDQPAPKEQLAGPPSGNFKKPLVVLGGLSEKFRSVVYEFLLELGAPVYAEAPSGLREALRSCGLALQSGEGIFREKFVRSHFDGVLRVGSVPTTRLWRDLEEKLSDLPVFSISERPFSGLARQKETAHNLEDFLKDLAPSWRLRNEHTAEVLSLDRLWSRRLNGILEKYPKSEPGLFRSLSQIIPDGARVFLGNSLPIREWDLAAQETEKQFAISSNRGANGIDGLVSTFMGEADANRENWLVLGDLSALYDLNALALERFVPTSLLRVVVIHNGGGQIFKRMFRDPNFINAHDLDFAPWAALFGWNYQRDLKAPLEVPTILELRPDSSETEEFWKSYEGIFT